MDKNSSIASAIDLLGGPGATAKKVGAASYQAVQQWRKIGSVPAKYCPAIEQMTGGRIGRHDLRPDDYWLIWPDLAPPADDACVTCLQEVSHG